MDPKYEEMDHKFEKSDQKLRFLKFLKKAEMDLKKSGNRSKI